jgi:hypothetical protein
VSTFWHIVNADTDPTPGATTSMCLQGPCDMEGECGVADDLHVMVSGGTYTKPLLYAEIRKGRWSWHVRIMRRNQMGDSYSRTSWNTGFWSRGGAEEWATEKIAQLSRPEAPPIVFIPEEIVSDAPHPRG